jgi:hypothetical protein
MTMILTRLMVVPRAGKPNYFRGLILVASMGHVNRAFAANCRATEKHLCWFMGHGSEV